MADQSKEARERAEVRFEKAQKATQDAAQAKADRQATTRAIDEKTTRLRALRLARDAAEPPAEVKAKPARKVATGTKRSPAKSKTLAP